MRGHRLGGVACSSKKCSVKAQCNSSAPMRTGLELQQLQHGSSNTSMQRLARRPWTFSDVKRASHELTPPPPSAPPLACAT